MKLQKNLANTLKYRFSSRIFRSMKNLEEEVFSYKENAIITAKFEKDEIYTKSVFVYGIIKSQKTELVYSSKVYLNGDSVKRKKKIDINKISNYCFPAAITQLS